MGNDKVRLNKKVASASSSLGKIDNGVELMLKNHADFEASLVSDDIFDADFEEFLVNVRLGTTDKKPKRFVSGFHWLLGYELSNGCDETKVDLKKGDGRVDVAGLKIIVDVVSQDFRYSLEGVVERS